MEPVQQEVLDLLGKWLTERRIVHCSAVADALTTQILGRIDTIKDGIVHLSQTQTTSPLGDRTFVEFSVSKAIRVEYSDAAHMTGSILSTTKGHDSVRTLTYPSGDLIGLDVLQPLDELLAN